jgi:hypothetical protein
MIGESPPSTVRRLDLTSIVAEGTCFAVPRGEDNFSIRHRTLRFRVQTKLRIGFDNRLPLGLGNDRPVVSALIYPARDVNIVAIRCHAERREV